MTQGPIWYRAMRYNTHEEAEKANRELKRGVDSLRGHETLTTIMFSNPAGSYFVAALGYPSAQAREQVEKLMPTPVTLSREDIGFMREAISEYRRSRGVSDSTMASYADERLHAAGAPDEFRERIVGDIRHGSPALGEAEREERRRLASRGLSEREVSNRLIVAQEKDSAFTGQLASASPALPGLQPGAPLRIRRIPFIIGYRDLQARAVEGTPDKYHVPKSAGTQELEKAMNEIIARKLKRAEKYQFDKSAIAMLETVRDPGAHSWLSLAGNIWVEFTQAINTPYGEDIRAIYAHSMDMEADIREVAPVSRNLHLHRLMVEGNERYKGYWSLNVITSRCEELFDFTYSPAQGRYIYPYSHKCPYGKCDYILPETRYTLGECMPCPDCRAAVAYWASVLHTAIRMIRREYALAPEEPRPYPLAPEGYTETVSVKVGKGKHQHEKKKEVTREVDYRLVSFEVSESYPARALGEEIIAREEQSAQAQGKRANWLTLAQAGAPDSIIWEYRSIDTSRGRTLDPERNPRWKSYQHIEITPYKKWVPMLAGERRSIKRVHARRYAGKKKQDS